MYTENNVRLCSLITNTPQEWFELAIKLSRKWVQYTWPDIEVLNKFKSDYDDNTDSITAASQVIATNFQTVAAANNYRR